MKWLGLVCALLLAAACGGVSGGANDFDGDGFDSIDSGGDDCNDFNEGVNPEGIELCNDGIDSNCDGEDNPTGGTEVPYNGIDDDCDPQTADDDLDGDGFSQNGGGDCADDDDTIFPGADEIPYDDIDQDCSGSDLNDIDHDGHVGVAAGGDDCDDLTAGVNPDVTEVPFDSVDQDCDGADEVGIGAIQVNETTAASQEWPDVVRSASGYAVTWIGYDGAEYGVWARILDSDGKTTGSEVRLRTTANQTYRSQVGWDGTNYLVVWGEYASGWKIYGQRFDTSGAAVDGLLTLANSANEQFWPSLAFNGTNYFVAWRAYNGSDRHFIQGRTVPGGTGAVGTLRTVYDPGASKYAYDPAVGSDGSTFLVTWYENKGASSNDIAAMVVKNDGTNLLVSPTVVSNSPQSTYQMDIAFDGTNYLVAFNGSNQIFGQFVNTSGIAQMSATNQNFVISDAPQSRERPSVVYVDGYYLVVWMDNRYSYTGSNDVYGQRVGTDGSLMVTSSGTNEAISATAEYGYYPAVASDGTNALLTFQFQDTGWDIATLLLTP